MFLHTPSHFVPSRRAPPDGHPPSFRYADNDNGPEEGRATLQAGVPG